MHKKYFIAIVLSGTLLERAERIKLELYDKYGLRGALRSPAHITLHRPFEWKEEKEPVLIETLSQFKYKQSFILELKGFNCFEPRVIYIDLLKNENLCELHEHLKKFAAKRLGLLNEVEDLRGFHPHITIAFRDLKKPLFYTLWEEFRVRNCTGSVEVTSINLLKLEEKWEVLETFNI